jgi:glyoxylase-like metal-dependent hydrolase (beta-lactamase superfamily II)
MLEFTPVSSHIWRLELPFKILGMISAPVAVWLIRHAQGWTQVDAGPPEMADVMVSAVARATAGRGPMQVLLTHAHYDHAGGLAALRQAWGPAILCHQVEAPFVTGEWDYRDQKAKSATFWFGRFLMRNRRWMIPVSLDLESGQSASGMVVIFLPGHTLGQVGYLHPEDQAMICGDAVTNLSGRLAPPFGISTPDPVQAQASMRRLGELEFIHLLPSHGPPILHHGRQALLAFLQSQPAGRTAVEW